MCGPALVPLARLQWNRRCRLAPVPLQPPRTSHCHDAGSGVAREVCVAGPVDATRYRKLRIAWSVAWGVVVVLLCVLWVRSYGGRMSREVLVTPEYRYYVHSVAGTVAFEREQRVWISVELQFMH